MDVPILADRAWSWRKDGKCPQDAEFRGPAAGGAAPAGTPAGASGGRRRNIE
jgi:hypothetical protein